MRSCGPRRRFGVWPRGRSELPGGGQDLADRRQPHPALVEHPSAGARMRDDPQALGAMTCGHYPDPVENRGRGAAGVD
ncbi:hypothetical protein [Actinoalloteichus caeruleus]|uniref:hypothetical protein n=1 Tax=Actinoalloteichus cyanogriseus TaxID=2893586 RepID=UPI003AAFF86A